MTEQKPMTTQDAAKQREEAQHAYDEAIKQMTDRSIFDRVRAAHPHANTGPDALKAMVDDYARLKDEAAKAAAGQEQRPA